MTDRATLVNRFVQGRRCQSCGKPIVRKFLRSAGHQAVVVNRFTARGRWIEPDLYWHEACYRGEHGPAQKTQKVRAA